MRRNWEKRFQQKRKRKLHFNQEECDFTFTHYIQHKPRQHKVSFAKLSLELLSELWSFVKITPPKSHKTRCKKPVNVLGDKTDCG